LNTVQIASKANAPRISSCGWFWCCTALLLLLCPAPAVASLARRSPIPATRRSRADASARIGLTLLVVPFATQNIAPRRYVLATQTAARVWRGPEEVW